MNNINRNKDLLEVFNERWKANHSLNIKQMKEKEKKFNERMFGNIKKDEKSISNKPIDRVNRLNEKINSANNINRIANHIDFKNNFR